MLCLVEEMCSRGELFLASSSFWWLPAFYGLWPHHSNLCLRGHIAFFVCLSNFPLPPAYKNTCGWGFPGGAVVKNPPANSGDMGSSPGLGRSHVPWSS